MTYLISTATAFPEHYYPQTVLAAALRRFLTVADLDFDQEPLVTS